MTQLLRRAWGAMDRWFFMDVPLAPLALGRIALGITCYLQYAVMRPDLEALWGPEGLTVHLGDEKWLNGLLPLPLVYHALLLGAVTLTLGFFTRTSAAVVLLGHLFFAQQTDLHTWGSLRPMTSFLLYYLLSRCGRAYSLDAHLARRRGETWPAVAPAWPQRLVQVHLAMLYYSVAVPRLWNPTWWRGEMAFEASVSTIWARFPYVDWMALRTGLEVFTYLTWAIELAAPVLLFVPRTRTTWAVLLVFLHVGMEVVTDTASWQYLCLAALLTFLPPAWSEAALSALTRPFARLAGRRELAPER